MRTQSSVSYFANMKTNRRQFAATLISAGVALFLPNTYQPKRYKRMSINRLSASDPIGFESIRAYVGKIYFDRDRQEIRMITGDNDRPWVSLIDLGGNDSEIQKLFPNSHCKHG